MSLGQLWIWGEDAGDVHPQGEVPQHPDAGADVAAAGQARRHRPPQSRAHVQGRPVLQGAGRVPSALGLRQPEGGGGQVSAGLCEERGGWRGGPPREGGAAAAPADRCRQQRRLVRQQLRGRAAVHPPAGQPHVQECPPHRQAAGPGGGGCGAAPRAGPADAGQPPRGHERGGGGEPVGPGTADRHDGEQGRVSGCGGEVREGHAAEWQSPGNAPFLLQRAYGPHVRAGTGT
mmetsp:Transcript_49576/g.83087  ORF Transcript_49576/g.83087 Transcript_49576/m.83087 type:complete len:232 (-) Transcript_49576:370-1065(-)